MRHYEANTLIRPAPLSHGQRLRVHLASKRLRTQIFQEAMCRASGESLQIRTKLLDWAISSSTRNVSLEPVSINPDIKLFSYWNNGVTNSPPIVQACVRSQQRWLPHELILLNDMNLNSYVEVPEFIQAKRALMSTTHFSDILRLLLLRKYGGVWLDSTLYLSNPLPSTWMREQFFAFTRPNDPYLLSVWFLQANQGSYIVPSWLQLLLKYWEDFDEVVDYFVLHHLFEILCLTDKKFWSEWSRTPVLSHVPPHHLQARLCEPFDENILQEAFALSAIHKLTYKINCEKSADESVVQALSNT